MSVAPSGYWGEATLLAKLEGERSLCYAQVPFVNSDFIDRVVQITRYNASQRGLVAAEP